MTKDEMVTAKEGGSATWGLGPQDAAETVSRRLTAVLISEVQGSPLTGLAGHISHSRMSFERRESEQRQRIETDTGRGELSRVESSRVEPCREVLEGVVSF
jgi:hypothetical protein